VINMANETTSFPTMGDGWMQHVVNTSGARSPYTQTTPKKGPGSADDPASPAKGNRSATTAKMGSESNGPAGHIVAKICYPNDSNAGLTQRNLKKVSGSNSFMGARKAAGNDKYGA
jgi:hypothetical protein